MEDGIAWGSLLYGRSLVVALSLLPSRMERRAEMHPHQLTAAVLNAPRECSRLEAPTSTLSSWELSVGELQPAPCAASHLSSFTAPSWHCLLMFQGVPCSFGSNSCLKVMGSMSLLPDGPWLSLIPCEHVTCQHSLVQGEAWEPSGHVSQHTGMGV